MRRFIHYGLIPIVAGLLLSGCATLPADSKSKAVHGDPLQPANRVFYGINETLDDYLMQPVAEFYAVVTPAPMRESVGNFFSNLGYLNVILNSFLQGKADQGWSDVSRFVINSTLGIGGLFDVASNMGFASHEEDLGQTLAVWGSGQGAYLVVPMFGPNTVRDAPNLVTSVFLHPLFYITSSVVYPLAVLGLINRRAQLLEATAVRDTAAIDPYIFTREAYLQRREFLIYDGQPPAGSYDDLFGGLLDTPDTETPETATEETPDK